MTRMFRPGERPRVPAPGNGPPATPEPPGARGSTGTRLLVGAGGGSIFGPKLPGPRIASSAGNNMLERERDAGWIEGLALVGRTGEIPRVHERVAAEQPADQIFERHRSEATRHRCRRPVRVGEASRISAVAARHRPRGRGRLPAAVERSRRDRPPRAGEPTRRGPRGPAHSTRCTASGPTMHHPTGPTTQRDRNPARASRA